MGREGGDELRLGHGDVDRPVTCPPGSGIRIWSSEDRVHIVLQRWSLSLQEDVKRPQAVRRGHKAYPGEVLGRLRFGVWGGLTTGLEGLDVAAGSWGWVWGWAQGRTCRDEGVQVGTWDDILSREW